MISSYIEIFLNANLTDHLLLNLNSNFIEILNSPDIVKDPSVLLELCEHLSKFLQTNADNLPKYKPIIYLMQILITCNSCQKSNILEIIKSNLFLLDFIIEKINNNLTNINIIEQSILFIDKYQFNFKI